MTNLKVKDFSVSNENFTLIKNEKYGFLETYPQPKIEDLSAYYKFSDYISHTNTKRNLFEKLYHLVRSITLNQKINLIKSNHDSVPVKNVLDVGCGTGHFLKSCLDQGWNVTGIEPDVKARTLASTITNQTILDSEDLFKLKNLSFDVITLWHVLEHLPNLEAHIEQLKKLLKPNGILIIAVPNYKSYDAEYYKSFWAAYDVPRHLWHFNQKSLEQLTNNFGLKVVKKNPMWFDAFYVSMLSEKFKTGKNNFIRAFLIGLRSNIKSLSSREHSSVIYVINKS